MNNTRKAIMCQKRFSVSMCIFFSIWDQVYMKTKSNSREIEVAKLEGNVYLVQKKTKIMRFYRENI